MRPYEYRCKDYSLLTPLFKRVFVTPLVDFLPWGLPANIITIFSNMLVYLAFLLAIQKHWLGEWNYLIIPVLLFGYLVGDHLDGAQAKRTKTGSALGEFCDHYLDAFNNGLIVFILFSLFSVTNSWLIAVVLLFSYLAHTIVFYEQFRTGWLIFERLGSLEGVLLSCLLIVLGYFSGIRGLYEQELLLRLSLIEWVLVLTAFGGLLTFVKTLIRLNAVGPGLWFFGLALVVVCFTGSLLLSILQVSIVVTLYASLYIGRLMTGHLIDGKERQTDPLVPLALIAGMYLTTASAVYLYPVLSIYLILTIIFLIYRNFMALRKFWVWKNPPVS